MMSATGGNRRETVRAVVLVELLLATGLFLLASVPIFRCFAMSADALSAVRDSLVAETLLRNRLGRAALAAEEGWLGEIPQEETVSYPHGAYRVSHTAEAVGREGFLRIVAEVGREGSPRRWRRSLLVPDKEG